MRDSFPDVLRGLITAEEARDIPPEPFTGTTIEATPTPRSATANAIQDEIPTHVMDAQPQASGPEPEMDPQRDRVDHAIAIIQKAASDLQVIAVEAKCRPLMADLDADQRPELKDMVAAALEAARKRVMSRPAEDDDGWPGPATAGASRAA